MALTVLVTGGAGLIGRNLIPALENSGYCVISYDRRPTLKGRTADILDDDSLRTAVSNVDGVIHLAAVSRVIWGEQDPLKCEATNVAGTRRLVTHAVASRRTPWLIFASSREVYGQQEDFPVKESAHLEPVNVYGRSKVRGEQIIALAKEAGVRTAVIRFSSVYGDTQDHADRVVPAFCRAALAGQPLRVEGQENCFDFTYIDDVVVGLARVVAFMTQSAESLEPLHLVSGRGISLQQVADTVIALSGQKIRKVEAARRSFDVWRFVGDPARAHAVLGWRAATPFEVGLSALVEKYRATWHCLDIGSSAQSTDAIPQDGI